MSCRFMRRVVKLGMWLTWLNRANCAAIRVEGKCELDVRYPWEAEPRTAVREPKLPGGASEISMLEESEGDTPGGAEPMVCGPGAETPLVGGVLLRVRGVAYSCELCV